MQRIEIVVCQSPITSSAAVPIKNITEQVDGAFSWTIAAQGGFKTATLQMRVPIDAAFNILNFYLGKRIQFLHPEHAENYQPRSAMGVCWEGMISTITIDDGQAPITRSVANVYNYVTVIYSGVDYTQTRPVLGQQKLTATSSDIVSRNLYGIRELYYSTSGMSDQDAINLRNVLFNRYKLPITQFTQLQTGANRGMSTAVVTLDCTGYWETFDKRFDIDTTNVTPITIDALLRDVLTPLSGVGEFLLADFVLTPNTLTHSPYRDKIMTVAQYINKLCSYGHAGATGPSFFGIYGGPTSYYTPYPTQSSYRLQRFDTGQRVIDDTSIGDGRVIPPFLVRPGKIITVPDVLPDAAIYTDDVQNVRSFVIGEIAFTAPNKLTITPATNDPTQVVLSRMGL